MNDADVLMHAIVRDHRLRDDCVDCKALLPLHARLGQREDAPLDAAVLAWVIHGLGFENFETVYLDDVTEPTAEQERVAARIAGEYQKRRIALRESKP